MQDVFSVRCGKIDDYISRSLKDMVRSNFWKRVGDAEERIKGQQRVMITKVKLTCFSDRRKEGLRDNGQEWCVCTETSLYHTIGCWLSVVSRVCCIG